MSESPKKRVRKDGTTPVWGDADHEPWTDLAPTAEAAQGEEEASPQTRELQEILETKQGLIGAEQSLGKLQDDFQTHLPSLADVLSPSHYAQIIKERTQRETQGHSEISQEIADILSGKASEGIKTELDKVDVEIKKQLEALKKPLLLSPEAIKAQLVSEISRLKTGLKTLEDTGTLPDNFPKNPLTGLDFDSESLKQYIALQNNKIDYGGFDVRGGEVAGALLLQLLDPRQADTYFGIPYALKQERLAITTNEAVQRWETNNKANTVILQNLSQQQTWLRSMFMEEHQKRGDWQKAVFENDRQLDRLKLSIRNQDWQVAVKEAGDILDRVKGLPPDMVKSSLKRYNNLVSLANKLNPDLEWGTILDEDITKIVNDVEYTRRQNIISAVLDQYYKIGKTFETITNRDKDQLRALFLAAGPLWDGEKKRNIAFEDLGMSQAEEKKPTQQTAESEANRLAREKQEEANRKSREKIASEGNKSRESVAKERTTASSGKVPATIHTARAEEAGLKKVYEDDLKALKDEIARIKKGDYKDSIDNEGNFTSDASKSDRKKLSHLVSLKKKAESSSSALSKQTEKREKLEKEYKVSPEESEIRQGEKQGPPKAKQGPPKVDSKFVPPPGWKRG